MADVFDVAQYILSKAQPDAEDFISNLKLQKLLYYSQGFHLAIYDTPLFKDPIVAWQYGPVVKRVYNACKKFGYGQIACDCVEGNAESLTPEQKQLIDDVYDVYGQFSAGKLCEMTHSEPPWKNASINQTIKQSAMKEFFKTLVVS